MDKIIISKSEYAICKYCGVEMYPGNPGCLPYVVDKDGKKFKRLSSDEEGNQEYPCGDCGIGSGAHHFGCDLEICPKCEGQMLSCGCDWVALEK